MVLTAQVTVFQQANYLENFVQSTFDALPAETLAGESVFEQPPAPLRERLRQDSKSQKFPL